MTSPPDDPHNPSVSAGLLSLSLTELFPPRLLLPPVSSVTALSPSQDTVVKDSFVVKQSLLECSAPQRLLFSNESCSCERLSLEEMLAGWRRNNGTLVSGHVVHPIAYSKSELAPTRHNLTKLPGGSKTDVTGRLYKGYYEKTDIPFHFQHYESVSAHIELYCHDHTYPVLEEWCSRDMTSLSTTSVIEPKQLTLGVSRPEGAEYNKPSYTRLPRPRKKRQTLDRKHHDPFSMYHSLDNLATKSATVLEVYHGQTSSLSLGNLPAPSDSPTPSHPRTDLQYNHHFKDIINIEDSSSLKHRKKPSVRWASHQLPPNLVSSPHKTRVESPRLRRAFGFSLGRKPWATSLPPPAKGCSLRSDTLDTTTHTAFTKVPLPTKRKEPHSEVNQGTRSLGRRNIKPDLSSSVSLMPTSKALVPSLGVYTRTALAHNSLDHF